MALIAWIVAGVAAGTAAGWLIPARGLLEDIITGVVGAIIGGWLYANLAGAPIAQPSLQGSASALLCSLLFLAIARALTRGRAAI